jgi:hypothetical protein
MNCYLTDAGNAAHPPSQPTKELHQIERVAVHEGDLNSFLTLPLPGCVSVVHPWDPWGSSGWNRTSLCMQSFSTLSGYHDSGVRNPFSIPNVLLHA